MNRGTENRIATVFVKKGFQIMFLSFLVMGKNIKSYIFDSQGYPKPVIRFTVFVKKSFYYLLKIY